MTEAMKAELHREQAKPFTSRGLDINIKNPFSCGMKTLVDNEPGE
ncbi:hypothetical protein [Photobacterium halotolerans]|nr:hypothetical protein [Photobacterium halotolerans]